MRIAEVIANKYLQKYNKYIVERIRRNPYCPSIFGYEAKGCVINCIYCYDKGLHEFTIKNPTNIEGARRVLADACSYNSVPFIPTDEFKEKLKKGE